MSLTYKNSQLLNHDDMKNEEKLVQKNTLPFQNKNRTLNIKSLSSDKIDNKSVHSKSTRELIKHQQQKRKLSDSKVNLKQSVEREEIQKRLNLLKQNTLQIVCKNVKNAKKKNEVKHRKPILQSQKKNTTKTSDSTNGGNKEDITPSAKVSSPSIDLALVNLDEKIEILRQTDDSASLSNNSQSLYTSMQTTFSEKLSELINIENEYQLKVPETRLRTPIKDYLKNDLIDEQKSTPFWLKPSSSVQSYPYNFIMAVRKKLESLSHPIQGPLQKSGKNYDISADESKVRSNKYTLDSQELVAKKVSISDINTNFSSISLNVLDSNTISDVSSIKSESMRNLENIDQKSINCSLRENKNVHSPLSFEKINNLRIQSDLKTYTNEKEELMDLQTIFEAFNKKLSQCIEVNQQLYSSLNKPQKTQENFTDSIQFTDKKEYNEDFKKETETNFNNKSRQDFHEEISKELSCYFEQGKNSSNIEKTVLFDLENKENTRSLMGNEILTVFNQFELNNTANTSAISETSLNYSNIGMYDQLLLAEISKSEHLTSIKKKREKYLIDWTKGQISWLELQRQKCKETGELSKIKAIKKKQRALLMKLENAKTQNEFDKTQERQQKPLKMVPLNSLDSSRILVKLTKKNSTPLSTGALKVFEPNHSNLHLERILHDRENKLEKRREQVQSLIKWHQRLDNEEAELILMEKVLEKYNLHKNVLTVEFFPNKTTENVDVTHLIMKDQQRFNKIENSLKILLNITPVNLNDHFVEASGIKMNRLWKRLTGENAMKFDQKIIYKLSKSDLENVYEEAKSFVIKQFDNHKNIKKLLENSEIRSDSDVMSSVKTKLNKEEYSSDNKITEEQISLEAKSLQYSSDFFSDANHLDDSQSEKAESKETIEIIETEKSENTVHEYSNVDLNISQEISLTENEVPSSQPIFNDPKQSETFEDIEINDEISCIHQDNNLEINPITLTIDEITSLSNNSYTEIISQNPEDDKSSSTDESDQIRKVCEANEVDENTEVENLENNISEHDENSTISNEASMEHISEAIQDSVDLEKRLISLDDCLKDLNTTFDVLNSQENSTEIKSPENISTDLAAESSTTSSSTILISSDDKILDNFRLEVKIRSKPVNEAAATSVIKDLVVPDVEYKKPAMTAGMPDIINEAEVLRRQQLQIIEEEIQRLEQIIVPAVFLREIPNKPPPPYVFPTVCPAENKIVEIIETQVKLLYENTDIKATETTNVYERIISDVCKEVFNECKLNSQKTNQNYLNNLSLYNPSLKAIQVYILEKIKQLLLFEDDDKTGGENNRRWSNITTGGKKRDLVDEILIREMFENNSNWTNFDLEEFEVKDNIFNDLKKLIAETEII